MACILPFENLCSEQTLGVSQGFEICGSIAPRKKKSPTVKKKKKKKWNNNDKNPEKKKQGLRMLILVHNPNTIKSYKILQKLSPKHAAHGVAQSPYPIYRDGKACLSKQPPWRAAPDPRLARGRSRVRAPGPAGALRALFFSTLPSFLLREIVLFAPSPPNPRKC